METRGGGASVGEHGFVDFLFVGLIVGLLTLGAAAAPAVSDIALADADPTKASSVDFTVTFDESVTGVDTTDFVVDASGIAGASIGAVSGGGTAWTVSVGTGTGDGTLSIDLTDDDSIEDDLGNPLGGTGAGNGDFTAGAAYTVDKTPPSVPTGLTPADGAYLDTWSPTLSWEPSSDTGGSGLHSTNRYRYDVDLEGADCKDDYTLSTSYHPTLSSEGVYTWRLYSRDNAGNHSDWTDWHTFTVDTDKPDVTIDQAGGQVDPTNASPVMFDVEFDEPIDGATFMDVDVSVGGSATTGAVTVTEFASDDGTTFRVEIIVSVDGTVEPTISAGGIEDLAGNTNNASTSTDNSVTYDTDPPGLTSFELQSPATSPTNTDTLVFRVTFDEAIANWELGDFTVNSTSTAYVDMVTLVSAGVFDVTVTGGDLAGFNGTVGLDLAGGQDIGDLAGNPLPAGEPPTDETYTVDNEPPGVAGVTENLSVVADADAGDQTFTLTIGYDEPMDTGVAPTVSFPSALEDPSSTIAFDPASGWTNDTTYVARYDVVDANEEIEDIDLRVAGARDAVGNTQIQHDEADVFSIDTLNPTIAWIIDLPEEAQSIDDDGSLALPIEVLVTDGGCIGAANVAVSVSDPPDVTVAHALAKTQEGSSAVRMEGDVMVSALTDGEAAVTIGVNAEDCCGNSASASDAVTVIDDALPTVSGFTVAPDDGRVDPACEEVVAVAAVVRDGCCIDAGSVIVTPTVSHASLKGNDITVTQTAQNEATVAGTIIMHELTGCPATIEVKIDATDCAGNRNVWTESAELDDGIAAVVRDLRVDRRVLVDDCCEAIVTFDGYVEDNCCVQPEGIAIKVTHPTENAAVTFDQAVGVVFEQTSRNRVDFSGEIRVRCLTSCPAIVRVTVQAEDACGNRAVPVASTADGNDPNETGHVVDNTAPIPRDDPRQDTVTDESAVIDPLVEVRRDGFGVYRFVLREDTPGRIDVLANDADNCSCADAPQLFAACGDCPDCCAAMTVHEVVTQPTHGTATIEDGEGECSGGSVIRFAPYHGYVGPDEFTYRTRDACGNVSSGIATVYLEVIGRTAMEDVYVTARSGEPTVFTVRATDLWADADPGEIPLRFAIVNGPSHGVVAGDVTAITVAPASTTDVAREPVPTLEEIETAQITLTYTSAIGYVGRDAIAVRFEDPFGNRTTARVDIRVMGCVVSGADAPAITLAHGESLPIVVPPTFGSGAEPAMLAAADGTPVLSALTSTWNDAVGRFVLTMDGESVAPGTYALTIPLGNEETVKLTVEVCVPDP